MKKLLWKIILIGSIPATSYFGYEVVKIVKEKDVVLSVVTGMLFLKLALGNLSELIGDE